MVELGFGDEGGVELAEQVVEFMEGRGLRRKGMVRVCEEGIWMSSTVRKSLLRKSTQVSKLADAHGVLGFGLEDDTGRWWIKTLTPEGEEEKRQVFRSKSLFSALGMIQALRKMTDAQPHSVVVVIGDTGSGKSLFCSKLCGLAPENSVFRVGSTVESETTCTKACSASWFGHEGEDPVVVVDTPGWNDSKGRDDVFLEEMISKIAELGSANTFVLLFNGDEPRLRGALIRVLEALETRLGPRFWEHVILVFSRWYMDKSSQRRRKVSRQDLAADMNRALVERFPAIRGMRQSEKFLKAFFVDSKAGLDDEEQEARDLADEEFGRFSVFARQNRELDCSQASVNQPPSSQTRTSQTSRSRRSSLQALRRFFGDGHDQQQRMTLKVEVKTGPRKGTGGKELRMDEEKESLQENVDGESEVKDGETSTENTVFLNDSTTIKLDELFCANNSDEFVEYGQSAELAEACSNLLLTFQWRDQGFGNRKGQVGLFLVDKDGETVASQTSWDSNTYAPHEQESVFMIFGPGSDLVDKSGPGMRFLIKLKVGSGGGHMLFVNQLFLQADASSYLKIGELPLTIDIRAVFRQDDSDEWLTVGRSALLPGPCGKVNVSFAWRDQGSGNQKGRVGVFLEDKDGFALACRTSWVQVGSSDEVELAPHSEKVVDMEFDTSESLVALSKRGLCYVVKVQVGGGGGHELTLSDFYLEAS